MNKKEKVSKFQIWVTAIGFLGLLFVPSIAWVFYHDTIGDDASENRKLAEMPEFRLGNISAFPKKFENFYNDHVPFRKSIRAVWSNLGYFMLHDSPTTYVVLGKDDGDDKERWLFYSRDADYSPVRDAQGIATYPEYVKDKIAKALDENTKYLRGRKIDFYLLAIPNKENVYKEYLPDTVNVYNSKSRGEDLIECLDEEDKNIVYAKDEIMDAKKDYQLYYKHDTHWNELGAFYGFKSFMKKVFPNFDGYSYKIKWQGLQVSKDGETNFDMPNMMKVYNYFVDNWPKVYYTSGSSFDEYVFGENDNKITVKKNKNAPIKKRIMVVGDSYRSAMMPYFGRIFSESISMHRVAYNPELLDKYKPDIVVAETVERYFSVMGTFSFEDGK